MNEPVYCMTVSTESLKNTNINVDIFQPIKSLVHKYLPCILSHHHGDPIFQNLNVRRSFLSVEQLFAALLLWLVLHVRITEYRDT